MSLLSLGLQAFGVYDANRTTRKEAREEELLANEEARQIEARAKYTLAAGSYNADAIGKKVQKILSTQRANAAAGGNDTTDASVQAIAAETIQNASIDQLLTMAAAEDDAKKDRYLADVTRRTGQRQARAIRNRATANLITGTTGIIDQAADWAMKFA